MPTIEEAKDFPSYFDGPPVGSLDDPPPESSGSDMAHPRWDKHGRGSSAAPSAPAGDRDGLQQTASESEPEPEPEQQPSIPPLEAGEAQEILSSANDAKLKGNEHFKLGKWAWACDHYSEALDLSDPGAGTPEIMTARAVYFSNRAQCRIKMELFDQAEKDCTAALELNPNHVKTLLRRAKARELSKDKLPGGLHCKCALFYPH